MGMHFNPTNAPIRITITAADFASPNVPDGFTPVWAFHAARRLDLLEDLVNANDAEGEPLAPIVERPTRLAEAYGRAFGDARQVDVEAPPALRAEGVETVPAFPLMVVAAAFTVEWGPLVEIEPTREDLELAAAAAARNAAFEAAFAPVGDA
jgi:hypothetical protein